MKLWYETLVATQDKFKSYIDAIFQKRKWFFKQVLGFTLYVKATQQVPIIKCCQKANEILILSAFCQTIEEVRSGC